MKHKYSYNLLLATYEYEYGAMAGWLHLFLPATVNEGERSVANLGHTIAHQGHTTLWSSPCTIRMAGHVDPKIGLVDFVLT
jgi:hypothetical protein